MRTLLIIFLVIGTLLNIYVFNTFELLFILVFFLISSFALLFFVGSLNFIELKIFYFSFSLFWFLSGVSGLIDFFYYKAYLETDGFEFFEIANRNLNGYSLEDISRISTGSLAIRIWNFFYEFFGKIGYSNTEYIGKLVNIICVSFSLTLAFKILKLLVLQRVDVFKRIIFLFSTSGLLCMYAVMHLRDAFVLLIVTINLYFVINYLVNSNFKKFAIALSISVLISYIIYYLRYEFVFVPFLLFILGVFYKIVSLKNSVFKHVSLFLFVFFGVTISIFAYNYYLDLDMRGLSNAREAYTELTKDESSSNSIGLKIASLPFPINSILAYFIMLFGPIPIWVGFGFDSSYHLMKSLNAIYMYLTFPIFVLAIRKIIYIKHHLKYVFFYLVSIFLFFTILISLSSGDNRHVGTFMVPYLLICSLFIEDIISSYVYKIWVINFLFLVAFIHILWVILKFSF